MTSLYSVKKVVRDLLGNYQRAPVEFSARMGNTDGVTLYPDPSNTNIIWVRDVNGINKKAYNQSVPNVFDLAVKIGYEASAPRLLQVLRIDNAYGANPPYPAISPGIAKMLKFGGLDQLTLSGEQFYPGLVAGNSGMVITIYPFPFKTSAGGYGYCAYQTLDLTSYRPATGAQAFVIAGKDDGTITVVSGSTEATPELISFSDLPTIIDKTLHAIWGVRLFSGQTVVRQLPTYTDLYDLRWNFSILGNMNYRGAWSSLTAYAIDDVVTSGGSTYICILAHTNQVPPNATYWTVSEANKVVGPASATDGHLAVYDGTTGKLIKDGGAFPAGGGDVYGNAVVTDGHLAVFDVNGYHIKDGGAVPAGGGGGGLGDKLFILENCI